MRTRILTLVLSLFTVAGLTACANTDAGPLSPSNNSGDSDGDGQVQSTGLSLTSDTLGDTDVSRMRFGIQGVNCNTGQQTGFSETQTKDLEDIQLPGGIAKFENAPFDENSQHLFADAFFLVDAGCYSVTTTPLQQNGQPSQDCSQAHRDRVSVEDGATTEILLINQCEGVERGGLDVISSINHPPELLDLEYQKFAASCPATIEVCATARDVDNDPLEFVWSSTDAGQRTGQISVSTTEQRDDGNWRSCANVTVNQKGDYVFRVDIFDLDGNDRRMEDVLSEQEGQEVQSRDGLQFPVYSGVDCPEPEPQAKGRSVTMLFALTGAGVGGDIPWLIQNALFWVTPVEGDEATKAENSRIAVLVDDNMGDKFPNDTQYLLDQLADDRGPLFTFPNVELIREPEGGISFDTIEDFDVVWFQNADSPPNDVSTFNALQQFEAEGGGLILQGEDMAHDTFEGDASMEELTRLEYLNDGVTACGDRIAPDSGNAYTVRYTDEPLPVLEMIRGLSFQYPSDIDQVRPTLSGEIILGNALYSSGECSYRGPAVSAFDPAAQ